MMAGIRAWRKNRMVASLSVIEVRTCSFGGEVVDSRDRRPMIWAAYGLGLWVWGVGLTACSVVVFIGFSVFG